MEKSLAAVPAGKLHPRGLANLGDPEIEATLAHVGSVSTEPDHERTATYAVGTAASDGLRFRVLAPARAGRSWRSVRRARYRAESRGRTQGDPRPPRRRSDQSPGSCSRPRSRVGSNTQGSCPLRPGHLRRRPPFYAMRFIRGDSLKEAIAGFHADGTSNGPRRPLAGDEKLLRRFLDVCNAIDYAHSRGVLHRDLKPGNVMRGQARRDARGRLGTGQVPGTNRGRTERGGAVLSVSFERFGRDSPRHGRGYARLHGPEQAAGGLDRLGIRSDVYSLGATLYRLLVGKPPFDGRDVGAILRSVQNGEFPRPRSLDPEINRGLEAVCLKAMALDPGERYASMRVLAEDVERWMADEPVAAMTDPIVTRVLALGPAHNRGRGRGGLADHLGGGPGHWPGGGARRAGPDPAAMATGRGFVPLAERKHERGHARCSTTCRRK